MEDKELIDYFTREAAAMGGNTVVIREPRIRYRSDVYKRQPSLLSGPASGLRPPRRFSTCSRKALYSSGESLPSPSLSNFRRKACLASLRAERASATNRALSCSDKIPVPVVS